MIWLQLIMNMLLVWAEKKNAKAVFTNCKGAFCMLIVTGMDCKRKFSSPSQQQG